MMQRTFPFQAKLWRYPGKAGWYFVTVPQETTKEIDFYFAQEKRGWGSLPVHVVIGKTTWKTSIFPDRKTEAYLLPIKADIRKKEQLTDGDVIDLTVEVLH